MAVSAIANGGYLMRPYIVKEITDSEHQTIEKREPEIIRQVISNDTSKEDYFHYGKSRGRRQWI